MIFIDFPTAIAPGQSVISIQGWYAGDIPFNSAALLLGPVRIPLLPHARPDVQARYPDLHTGGFRGSLDLWNVAFENACAVAAGRSHLRLEFSINDSPGQPVDIPIDEEWLLEIEQRKAIRRQGILPNGLPDLAADTASLGLGLAPGDDHYRAYVGLPEEYDLSAAGAFFLLVSLGLRQHHTLLDVGCGSLRCGRLLIPYLNRGNYLGIEPNSWLVTQGLEAELGRGIETAKSPRFILSSDPTLLNGVGRMDYALANSIFSHASLPQIANWLNAISQLLSTAGALVATFVAGEEDYRGVDWVYPGCIAYRTGTIQQLAMSAGLSLRILNWRHLHAQTWGVFAKPKFPQAAVDNSASWNSLADSRFDLLR
jgi:hypothetical protein